MPTSKDKSVRGGNWVYRPYFRTKGGRIIRASDYGKRVFRWRKRRRD
jgi:hypothetical protein